MRLNLTIKLSLNTCRFKEICFNKIITGNVDLHSITEGFHNIFREVLLRLLPKRKVDHVIELISTLPKLSLIYKLFLLEDQKLLQHLKEALKKRINLYF